MTSARKILTILGPDAERQRYNAPTKERLQMRDGQRRKVPTPINEIIQGRTTVRTSQKCRTPKTQYEQRVR